MDNSAMWALLVGFFLPLVIAFIQRCQWGDTPRAIVAFLACVVAGAGTIYFSGQFSLVNWATTALLVLVAAKTSFEAIWHKTGVTDFIEKLTNR